MAKPLPEFVKDMRRIADAVATETGGNADRALGLMHCLAAQDASAVPDWMSQALPEAMLSGAFSQSAAERLNILRAGLVTILEHGSTIPPDLSSPQAVADWCHAYLGGIQYDPEFFSAPRNLKALRLLELLKDPDMPGSTPEECDVLRGGLAETIVGLHARRKNLPILASWLWQERRKPFEDSEGPSFNMILGLFHGLAAIPSLVPVEVWLPMVTGQRELTDTHVGWLYSLHTLVGDEVAEGIASTPVATDNVGVQDWCRGLMKAIGVDPMLEQRRDMLAQWALPIGCLAVDRPVREGPEGEAIQQENRAQLGTLFLELYQALLPLRRSTSVAQPVKRGPKIGRNDPCPCASGKKYKKCCLRKG